MSQPAYDRSLLAAAPALTRADRQAGYDVNALEQGSYYSSTRPPAVAAAAPPVDPFTDHQIYNAGQSPSPEPSLPPKKPWYKTTRGRALIALAVIILIGLIAGIAAGTAAARQSRNTTLLSNNNNSQNQNQGTQTLDPATDSPTSPITALPTSDASSNTSRDPLDQQPAATLTFGNGNGNGNGATPTSRGGSNQATTIVFGGASSPAIVAPTQGSGSSGSNDNDIPLICYTFPQIPGCEPYFENGP
jgi:hypothetical protein